MIVSHIGKELSEYSNKELKNMLKYPNLYDLDKLEISLILNKRE